MISNERMEQALRYLAETDEDCAKLKVTAEREKQRAKAIWSAVRL
jgi:hypothetical protein